jgi:hypothetical protein
MRRHRRQGAKVKAFTHRRLGVTVDIRLDKSTGDFNATFADIEYKATTLGEIQELITKAIEGGTEIEWQGVIIISFGGSWHSDDESVTIDLNYKREWFAKKTDGGWVHSEWNTKVYPVGVKRVDAWSEEKDRLASATGFSIWRYRNGAHVDIDFKIPFTDREDSETPMFYVAYTDEMWSALNGLKSNMRALRKQLVKVLGTEKLRAQFTAALSDRLKLLGTGD